MDTGTHGRAGPSGARHAAAVISWSVLPTALVSYLAFSAGGFFPGATGVAIAVAAVALVLRATLAARPFEGLGLAVATVAVPLGLFAVWALLSGFRSEAEGRAILEYDRALLYLLVLVLCGAAARTEARARAGIGLLALALAAVSVAGLATRALPDVFPIAPNVEADRLSFPLTYWNAMGLLAAMGIVLLLHLTSSTREPRPVRVAAAALVPPLAATLLLTYSRGAAVVCVGGIVVWAVLARPRGLPAGVISALPAGALALVAAYRADELATADPTTPAAVAQGHDMLLAVAGCAVGAAALRALLLRSDRRVAELQVGRGARRAAALAAAALVALLLGGFFAGDGPTKVERTYDRFLNGDQVKTGGDSRARLTDAGNNGRLDHWRVAIDAWHERPAAGHGAGTYAVLWAQDRPREFAVNDAHSLYAELLAELGLVGLVLVAAALLALMAGLAARARGPDREVFGAGAAVVVMWAVHAGVDWHWEMPAVTLPVFVLGGLLLARGEPDASSRLAAPGRYGRVVVALVLLVLSALPLQAALSQQRLNRAVSAFEQGDCRGAVSSALAATSALGARPEPFEVLAWCDARLGQERLGVRMAEAAVERDPRNWETHYTLALVRAANGADPRPAAARAVGLNPREGLARALLSDFRSTRDPRKWERRARSARLPLH